MEKEGYKFMALAIFIYLMFFVILIVTGLGKVVVEKDYITNLETQINQLKFEQEYIEYVKEDNERQIQ